MAEWLGVGCPTQAPACRHSPCLSPGNIPYKESRAHEGWGGVPQFLYNPSSLNTYISP